MKEILTLSLKALRDSAARHPPQFLEAVLARAQVAGGWVRVSWDDYNAAVSAWPMNVPPRQGLGDVVARSRAAKAESGCYDAAGRLVPGSPCDKALGGQK